MKTNLSVRFMVLTAMLMLSVLVVTAQPNFGNRACCAGRGGDGDDVAQGHGNMVERLDNFLELTDEQEKKMDELQIAHLKKVTPIRNEMLEKQAKLNTLRSADKPDMKAIELLIDDISKNMASLSKEREKHIQDVRALLTDKQKVMFDSHTPGMGCGMGKGHGMGRGKGMRNGNCRNQ